MDIATIVGLLAGFGLIFTAIQIGGDKGLEPFIDGPSVMITVGGSFAALLINFPLKTCLSTVTVIKKCFISQLPESKALIAQFKNLAIIVRKDGLLALESELDNIDDEFMKRGLEIVIGGADEDQVRNVLETELASIEHRHAVGKNLLDSTGAAAPAFWHDWYARRSGTNASVIGRSQQDWQRDGSGALDDVVWCGDRECCLHSTCWKA